MGKTIPIILALSLMAFQTDGALAASTISAISQTAPMALDLYIKDLKALPMVLSLKAIQSRLGKDTFQVISQPTQGTLKAVKPNSPTDPYYVYIPDKGFTGLVTFSYIVKNTSGQSAPATVTIQVGPNKLPSIAPKAKMQAKVVKTKTKILQHQIFFVSVTGKSSGNGSMKKPWDLQTALNQPAAVKPGDIIEIENGTYKGSFISNLNGTAAYPVILTSIPHGRVLIKSNSRAGIVALEIVGTYTVYKNFVIDQTSPLSLIQSPSGNVFYRIIVEDSSLISGPLTIKDNVSTLSSTQGVNTTLLGNYSTLSSAQ